MPGHNMAIATLGALILWIGWYGFNPGSELANGSIPLPTCAVTDHTLASSRRGHWSHRDLNAHLWQARSHDDHQRHPCRTGERYRRLRQSDHGWCLGRWCLSAASSLSLQFLLLILQESMIPLAPSLCTAYVAIWGTLVIGLWGVEGLRLPDSADNWHRPVNSGGIQSARHPSSWAVPPMPFGRS